MMPLVERELSEREKANKKTVVHELIEQSHIGRDFYFLLTVSTLITTLGLILDNSAVVIGGMLIAPLLSPILALGLAIITSNRESLLRSLLIIIKSTGIVLVLSIITAFFVQPTQLYTNAEILSRIEPTLPYMYIALLSGIAATYAWAQPKLSATLPGVAVVVALLPPLAATGIGIAEFDRTIIAGSFQLFLINLLGIAFSAALVFSLLGFHQMRWVEKKEIVHEKEAEEEERKKKKENGNVSNGGPKVGEAELLEIHQ